LAIFAAVFITFGLDGELDKQTRICSFIFSSGTVVSLSLLDYITACINFELSFLPWR